MQHINSEQLFHYFNNFVSHKKAKKKLIPVYLAIYICLVTIEIVGRDENFDCHFFKCWI